jgi:hypothetical protein
MHHHRAETPRVPGDHQRQPLADRNTGRAIEPEAPCARRTHDDAGDPGSSTGWRRAFDHHGPQGIAKHPIALWKSCVEP